MTKNLTEGNPLKLIIEFALPLVFGNLFQQLYNLVDTMIVGHYLGVEALAGVGATGCINFLIVGFCMGLSAGFVIPIAQRFGAGDEKMLRKFFANSIYLSVLFAALITTAVCIYCREILTLLQTPDDIIQFSYDYIIIIFGGIPATFLYNLLAGAIRSVGDSKTPLIFLIISTVLNVVLDYLFIVPFSMGIAGAAYATILSQIVAGLLCFIVIVRRFDVLHVKGEEWKIDRYCMGRLCGMGVPMGLQYSITAIGSVILQSSVNTLGSLAVASITAANKVSMLLICIFDALGSTMATYGGQNVGAKKLDRIRAGVRDASLIGIVFSIFSFGFAYFVGDNIIALFLEAPNAVMMAQARQFLLIVVAFYIPLVFIDVLRFVIQGVGFPNFAIIAGVLEMVARTLVGIFVVPVFGFEGACFASPFAWILADAFLFPAYFYVMKKLDRQLCKPKIGEVV